MFKDTGIKQTLGAVSQFSLILVSQVGCVPRNQLYRNINNMLRAAFGWIFALPISLVPRWCYISLRKSL